MKLGQATDGACEGIEVGKSIGERQAVVELRKERSHVTRQDALQVAASPPGRQKASSQVGSRGFAR